MKIPGFVKLTAPNGSPVYVRAGVGTIVVRKPIGTEQGRAHLYIAGLKQDVLETPEEVMQLLGNGCEDGAA